MGGMGGWNRSKSNLKSGKPVFSVKNRLGQNRFSEEIIGKCFKNV